jgi:hypothetical protein
MVIFIKCCHGLRHSCLMGNCASPSVRCNYPSYTSVVCSHSCISTARSYTQYNLSSILQFFLHTRCSHTGTNAYLASCLTQSRRHPWQWSINTRLRPQPYARGLFIVRQGTVLGQKYPNASRNTKLSRAPIYLQPTTPCLHNVPLVQKSAEMLGKTPI